MKLCYSDFTFTISDYFHLLRKREIVYEWIIPLIFAVTFFFIAPDYIPDKDISTFGTSLTSILVNVFAILVGFTITAIAIFTTVDINKIEILGKISNRHISGQKVTNYRFVYANLIYSAIANVSMLTLTLISVFLLYFLQEFYVLSMLIFGTLHVLLLTIRNTTSLYFIFFKPRS